MNFNDFQDECCTTAFYRENMKSLVDRLNYVVLGLASEAGEVAGKLKKICRDHGGYINYERAKELKKEVGDCLWYCAMIMDELDFNFQNCAEGVIKKLKDRQERGVLGGSGDNR